MPKISKLNKNNNIMYIFDIWKFKFSEKRIMKITKLAKKTEEDLCPNECNLTEINFRGEQNVKEKIKI